MTMTPEEKLAMALQLAEKVVSSANIVSHDGYYELDIDAVTVVLSEAIDRMQERVRAEGQAEGFASAIQQLRDMRGQKPQPAFARVAEMLALRLEQSRIPCAAIRETPHAEG